MKDKIFIFIIGLLLGAVIMAGGFLAFEKINNNMGLPEDGRMQMMERPNGERPDGEAPTGMPERNQNDGTRPEKPDNNSMENSKTL